MTIHPIESVRQAVAQARQHCATDDEAITAAAQWLGLPVEAVRECVQTDPSA